MTDMTANEMYDRVLRSLYENSAELARERRARETARTRRIFFIAAVFAAGVATGVAVGAIAATAL